MDGRSRYPLPDNTAPMGERCLQVTIPDDDQYQTLLLSAVDVLSFWMNYDRDAIHSGALVADVFKKVMASWTDCAGNPVRLGVDVEFDDMNGLFEVICDDNGDCHAEFRCSVCDPFIELATKADLVTLPNGVGKQPAPGGGTSDYCNKVAAIDGLVIPIPVTTGDLLTVTSIAGNWGDGSLAQYCGDGNVFFIECTGVGAAPVGGSDVVPTAPHMCLVVRFSTGYYALYPGGSLVIPSGVTSEQPFVCANKPTLNTGNGAIDVCFTVKNNQTAHWSHVFDFTVAPGGWTGEAVSDPATPSWIPGVGWVGAVGVTTPSDSYLAIGITFAATALSSIEIKYIVGANVGGFYGAGVVHGSTTSLSLNGTPGSHDDSFVLGLPGCTHIDIVLDENAGAATPATVAEVIVAGTGVNPF